MSESECLYVCRCVGCFCVGEVDLIIRESKHYKKSKLAVNSGNSPTVWLERSQLFNTKKRNEIIHNNKYLYILHPMEV